jgi:hypothetical protein
MSRWYDKRPRLGKGLDKFKEMDQEIREDFLNDIIDLVEQKQPSLLTMEKAYDFRLDSDRLRWYEQDPHCWLVFNVLEIADVAILESVEDYLDNKLRVA